MAVGQARQALKATLAEDLELTAHDRPRGGAGHVAESRVRLRQQADVGAGVAPLERARWRAAATVRHTPGGSVLADQARHLRPRQPRHLRQITPDDPLVGFAQGRVVEPHQRAADELVGGFSVGELVVQPVVAINDGTHIGQGLNSFGL